MHSEVDLKDGGGRWEEGRLCGHKSCSVLSVGQLHLVLDPG